VRGTAVSRFAAADGGPLDGALLARGECSLDAIGTLFDDESVVGEMSVVPYFT
jgi:hypothetical protein